MLGYIYSITSPSGNKYIGQTTNIINRFNNYKKLRCKGQHRILNSLMKYGVESHVFNIVNIIDVPDDIISNELGKLEIYYINYYDTFNNGLNLTLGGPGRYGIKHSIETKIKMSIASKGNTRAKGNIPHNKKYYTDEDRLILKEYQKEYQKEYYENNKEFLYENRKEYKKEWEIINKEKMKEYRKLWIREYRKNNKKKNDTQS